MQNKFIENGFDKKIAILDGFLTLADHCGAARSIETAFKALPVTSPRAARNRGKRRI